MLEQEMAEKNTILKFLAGSYAYGTNTENSDKDYIGVFIPDEEYVLGNKKCEQVQIRTNPSDSKKQNTKDDTDTVLYSLPKFLHLLTENNPTILETLYYPQRNILFCNDLGKRILDNRKLFPSTRVKHTYLGYSFSQKKALTHKKERWVELGKALNKLDTWEKEGKTTLPEILLIPSALREDKKWGEYQDGQEISKVRGLLQHQVESYGHRLKDIKEFGFSCKFASHFLRLLDQGLQFLIEGELTFPLPNNNLIRDVKLGKLKLDEILKIGEEKENLVEQAYVRSKLPHNPDREQIDKLQIGILKDFWGYR